MKVLNNDGPTLLTEDELGMLKAINAEFQKAKIALGDLELQKQSIFGAIQQIKADFSANEKKLIEKYGANSVINMATGEVTEKSQTEA